MSEEKRPLGLLLHELIESETNGARRSVLIGVAAWLKKIVGDFQALCNEVLDARAALGLEVEESLGERVRKIVLAARAAHRDDRTVDKWIETQARLLELCNAPEKPS